jgi:glyoxylase-like metal-dependent hydrolase (beta-lactamase superfamily II)
MTRDEYLLCRVLVADTGRDAPEEGVNFYHAAGFPADALHNYQKMFGMFGKYVAELPEAYKRLKDGDQLTFAGNTWEVLVGRGHSPEHACFFNAERNLFVSGDQLLPTISSNVSVYPTEPQANPLQDWLESLRMLKVSLPEDVLVLPAHGKPFRGAHGRLDVLVQEHLDGLEALLDLCKQPRRAIDTFPALFKSKISGSNLIMATGEAVAHLNYLIEDGELVAEPDDNGVTWYSHA